MTPGARTQASIMLIDQIFEAWKSQKRFPADKMLEQYFKGHRYIGSKDRGAVAELVYFVLRNMGALSWWAEKYNHPVDGRMLVLAALMLRRNYDPESVQQLAKDSQYSIDAFSVDEQKFIHTMARSSISHPDMPRHASMNYPEWLDGLLTDSFGEKLPEAMKAMAEQAPTDLRVNTLKTHREKLLGQLRAEGFECKPTELSPIGIRLLRRAPIFTSKFFKEGHFEVQDEGSQAVALLTDAKAGERVIDFCAGAGGKTLAIAAMMENKGRILAWDISEKRLGQINIRLKRAGAHNVQVHVLESENDAFIKRHKATADKVLVDAPCSGSGTWRRNPDLKWRFTRQDLDEVIAVQKSVLQSASRLVKVGGRIVYATCSVFKQENDRQIEEFLKNNQNFKLLCAKKIWEKQEDTCHPRAGGDLKECEEQDPRLRGDDTPLPAPAYLNLTPLEDGVDGFFAAILERLPA